MKAATYKFRKITRPMANALALNYHFMYALLKLNNFSFNSTVGKATRPGGWTAIEINNTCNLNCKMCSTQLSKRQKGYITPERFKRILLQLKRLNMRTISLHTVGEPFLHKQLEELFEIAKKEHFRIVLSTNGQLTSKIKSIIEKYWPIITYLRFSIDGATRDTYETIREGAKFKLLVNSLKMVENFNHGKKNSKIHVKIDAVVNNTTINEISRSLHVFQRFCDPEDINFHLINGIAPDSAYFKETFPFPHLVRPYVPCAMPFQNIFFTFDGKVTLCCRDYEGELIVGDATTSSLRDIWNGQEAESVRGQHLHPETLMIDSCKNCYGPYPAISEIVNDYIHYLYEKRQGLNPEQFGSKISQFLHVLNDAMKDKEKTALMHAVVKKFLELLQNEKGRFLKIVIARCILIMLKKFPRGSPV
ncbi:MAG: radical SAM protein [Candidatus Lokiarchaeota archaeon]|nr:radical SAM protein [Candidatus Lokiarchaeota archaeon]